MNPFSSWQAVFYASRTAFSMGRTQDTLFDQQQKNSFYPSQEALFTQSNARVLVGQAADGSFRLVSLPTQVYPAPTMCAELGLGPGMYYKFDLCMYAGDLKYKLALDGQAEEIDLSDGKRDNHTFYADAFLPLTQVDLTQPGDAGLEAHLASFAPVAWDASKAALSPAPLPGPAGAIYALILKNKGAEPRTGKVILEAGETLAGHYEDASAQNLALNRPEHSLRQRTLLLTRPYGAVGVHFHEGQWTRLEAPFRSERAFSLRPGEERVFETYVVAGEAYAEVMPVVYELHLHSALDWLNATAAFWRSRLGALNVGAEENARFSQELYVRCLLDNFNCLQTDAKGNLLAHWQGAPSHGCGVIWGIDVEPTAVSVAQVSPELARQVMLFFMTRSRAPIGSKDHSLSILVAPVIIAWQWMLASGDVGFLQTHPEVLEALQGIMDEVLALKAPSEALFPSRYSSDGPVGRRYDFGTNAKLMYAFDALAYLLALVGREKEAPIYALTAVGIYSAIERTMIAGGPFGDQITGGTNLKEDPGGFYLPDDVFYYDGEDTSSMLAPVYGACGLDWLPWVNYHRFARSLWCPHFDPEFGGLNWQPAEMAVLDGTGFFSRLGGSVTRAEMREALENLRRVGMDSATGSVFWWPHGQEYQRALTRCSQGQGAWAWQYREQWLGLRVDGTTHSLVFAPRGLLTEIDWRGFRAGEAVFDLSLSESSELSRARIRNGNHETWLVKVGFRQPGVGATDELEWHETRLPAGQEVEFKQIFSPADLPIDLDEAAMHALEAARWGQDGVLFKRYGPAMLWGHWDVERYWQPGEMPNALRFVIANLSGEDWLETRVALTSPAGWKAQPRAPQHWPRPSNLAAGEVALDLGFLQQAGETVAPFWVAAPGGKGLLSDLFGKPVSFHTTTQPGEGLRLVSAEVSEACAVLFVARLTALTRSGRVIERSLDVPVEVAPIPSNRN